jgi:hypothetical protein
MQDSVVAEASEGEQDIATRLATDGSGCCDRDLTQLAFTGSGDVQASHSSADRS